MKVEEKRQLNYMYMHMQLDYYDHLFSDTNECLSWNANNCTQHCENIKGSYKCRCEADFTSEYYNGQLICKASDSGNSLQIELCAPLLFTIVLSAFNSVTFDIGWDMCLQLLSPAMTSMGCSASFNISVQNCSGQRCMCLP